MIKSPKFGFFTRLLSVLLLGSIAHSANACQFSVMASNILIGGGGTYDPLSENLETAVLDILIARPETDIDCEFALSVKPINPSADGTFWFMTKGLEDLAFTLARDQGAANILRPNTGAVASNTINGIIPKGALETRIQLFALMEPGQLVAPGSYEIPIELQLASPAAATVREQLSIGTSVRSSAAISIVGGASSQVLDFEELEEFERLGTRLNVTSNAVYFLTLRSEHGGRLRREGSVGSNDYDFIDYTAYIDSQAVGDLEQQPLLGPFGSSEGEHDAQFEIGSVARKRAGTYSDFVTIEVRLIN